MNITREQVRAAHTALGLDPDLTAGVSIYGDTITVTPVALKPDGSPDVSDGILRYDDPQTITITAPEDTHGDAA